MCPSIRPDRWGCLATAARGHTSRWQDSRTDPCARGYWRPVDGDHSHCGRSRCGPDRCGRHFSGCNRTADLWSDGRSTHPNSRTSRSGRTAACRSESDSSIRGGISPRRSVTLVRAAVINGVSLARWITSERPEERKCRESGCDRVSRRSLPSGAAAQKPIESQSTALQELTRRIEAEYAECLGSV